MRILAHTHMGRPIRMWDIPYAYGTILCSIRVWVSHMSIHAGSFIAQFLFITLILDSLL